MTPPLSPTLDVPDPVTLETPEGVAGMRPATASGPRRLRHIPELDGLRGLAALMVFFHHACLTTVPDGRWGTAVQLLRRASFFGSSGVDVFFVLSGFLITSILLGDRAKPAFYAPFYWKRVLRIVPVYAVVLLYVVLFQPHDNVAVLFAALFVANLSLLLHILPVAPFWSLAIEEQFYLVWPTLVRRVEARMLERWAIGIAVATVGLRYLFASFGHYDFFLTFLHCDGLALGALLACQYVRREEQGGPAWTTVGLGWGLGAALFVLSGQLPERTQVETAFAVATGLTGITWLSLGLVGTLVFLTGSRVLAVFRSQVLVFFGLISYCFYLVHLYVVRAYDQRWGVPHAPDDRGYFVRLLVVLAGSVAVSVVSRYALELPVQRLRRFIPALQPRQG